ncbi:MAG TPA: hemolysin family protein [Gemmatimonadaceae bacterium]|nr:hemolysin family protein [Gemmatimonadaceae bacterium]
MRPGALTIAIVAALFGMLWAAADGALLALEPPRERGEGPTVAGMGARSRAHRALSFARIAAQLTAAIAVTYALEIHRALFPVALVSGLLIGFATMMLLETAPRAVGEAAGARMLAALRPMVRLAEGIFAPIVMLGMRAEARLQRAFPPEEVDEGGDSPEQLGERERDRDTPLPRDEPGILRGVFSLGDTEVQEVMVPRVDIMAVERGAPWSEVMDRVLSSEHARLPVYDETIDHIVGILYAKDLLPIVLTKRAPDEGWPALIRPATFVPASKIIEQQLRDFRATGTHIAIVVDEYGGTAGLVTIEDILEQIVGDIRDEYDVEEAPIEEQEGRRFWVSGRVSLDDLSAALGHRFEREDVATVGGLIFQALGRVPRAGEELTLDGFRIVVERVTRRRIERVYFERLEALAGREG